MMSRLTTRLHSLTPERKQFLVHALLAALFRVFSAAATFLLSVVAARVLGASESGLFFLGQSMAIMLGLLCLLGMNNALLRFIGHADTQDYINQVFTNAFRAVVPASVVAGLLVFFSAPWLAEVVFKKPQATDTLRWFAAAVPLVSLFFLNGYALQATRRVIASICSMQLGVTLLALPALLVLGALLPSPSSQSAALMYVLASALVVVSGLWLWFRQPGHHWDSSNAKMPELWQAIPNLCLISATGQAVPWASVVIVGMFVSAQDVAFFSAAQRTSLLISFMLMVINFVAAPRFAALHKAQKMAELKSLAQLSTRLMIAFSLPVLVAVLLWPANIMALFGDAFRQGATLLVILAIGQTINVMTGSVGFLLTMSGHEKDLRNITLTAGTLTLVMTLVATYQWGVMGAAIAVSVGVSINNLLGVHKVKQRLGFWPIG